MAIYTIQIKPVSRANGHSAIAKIAYNCRDKITNIQTGEIHKYNSKKMSADLLHSEITYRELRINNSWRSQIWNNAELAEKRKDSRTAREYVVALPKELDLEDNIELVREFARELTNKYNNVADWAIHDEKDGNGNIHAHILTTTREFDENTLELGERTAIEWNNTKCANKNMPSTQDQIKNIRLDWALILSRHLRMAGIKCRVSHERKEDRNTVKKHLGKEAVALERKGIQTEIGNHNRIIDDFIMASKEYDKSKSQLEQEELKLKRLEYEQELEYKKKQKEEQERQRKLQEAEQIARLKVARGNAIAYAKGSVSTNNRLEQYEKLMICKTIGDYKYWISKDNQLEVHNTHINVDYRSTRNIKLALDLMIAKDISNYILELNGDYIFILEVIEVIAQNPKYAQIKLEDPRQQEILDDERLEQEYEQIRAVDDSYGLCVQDEPVFEPEEPEPEEKPVIENVVNKGWDFDR